MKQISVTDLFALSDVTVIDVREPEEYAAGRATGAVNVPLGEVASRLAEIPAHGPVYLICHSGGRSARVTEALSVNGFDAINVIGGTSAWAQAGLPIETV
ncbi:MAG: hypothetical protein JWQ68_2140 [Cryobacterium sp.]|jgi:rhodanese-related sulfurtransferase|nr:hypothetical protein [Cryobacterium sp.]